MLWCLLHVARCDEALSLRQNETLHLGHDEPLLDYLLHGEALGEGKLIELILEPNLTRDVSA